jgi:predicted dehydrogenase
MKHSRRAFLRCAGAGVVLPCIVPGHLFGAEAPSNKITVGFIGTGDHGTHHNLDKYLKLPEAKVVMLCDVDGYRMRRAKAIVDAAYDNEDCAVSKDFRDVLARKDIDAVMISTPDHWHTLISVLAAEAGKDVQCEKPTLTIDEGKVLTKVIRRTKRVFQTSTEDRSLPMYHRMAELVRNGRIGKLQRIEVILPQQPTEQVNAGPEPVPADLDWEMWLGPAPFAPYTKLRAHYQFRWISDYAGGIIADWGTHLFDTAHWAADLEHTGPVEVEGHGDFWEGGLYDTVKNYDVTYTYANGLVMTCKPGNPSIKFIGSDGWVGNTGWRGKVQASSEEILNSQIGAEEVHLYTNPQGEHDDFLKCVRGRKDPYFPVEIGHRVATLCHMANIAIKLGRKLKWDPKGEKFMGDVEANAMCSRKMRAPWKLPEV